MAGLGYKDFTAGAVLTAAQVDGYLMEQSVMNFAGTAARGSALSSVQAAGMMAHVGGGTVTVYDGSAWQQLGIAPAAWTSFTPTLTAATTNPTLGTGSSATGAYAQIGKIVFYRFRIIFGSSGVNAGSGEYRVSVPVAANSVAVGHGALAVSTVAFLYDSSANVNWTTVFPSFITSTTFSLTYGANTGNTSVSSASPWTWAASDQIVGGLTYEAA
jgi:hypothetical protein